MLRTVFLTGLLALVVAVPAQANQGKELRITGQVVRVTANTVSVENTVGDAILTCAVPDRLDAKAAALKVGDRVRMICVRHKGRRATLVRFERPGAKKTKPVEKPDVEKKEAAGPIVEFGPAVIVVQGEGVRLACRVPAEKSYKVAALKLGDKVKIYCVDGQLVGLERYDAAVKPSGDEVRLYGKITAFSRMSVTVQGETGALTCTPPLWLAEKLEGRFAVGDSVKMMCRGTELTYLEKVA